MKKFYVSQQFKKLNSRRIKRENERRLIKKEAIRKQRIAVHTLNRVRSKINAPHYHLGGENKQEGMLTAPEVFSVVENTEEMAQFFSEFYFATFEAKRGLSIDMSKVRRLTGDAVIYMISMFERFKHQHPSKYRVRGNVPKDEECRRRLFHLGFQNYVRFSRQPADSASVNFISMRTGDKADGGLIKQILEFSKAHLPVDTTFVYQTLVECMANTNNHAYKEGERHPFWHLTAEFDENKREISFYFLDSGFGIPRTVRKTFAEQIRKIFPEPFAPSDIDLILSTLEGKFRTRTLYEYRGQGLPAIYRYFREKNLEDLIIISRKARVDLNGQNEILENPFYGTLISWKLKEVKGISNENNKD